MGWHMERALDTHHCSVDPRLLYFSMTMFGTQVSATREGLQRCLEVWNKGVKGAAASNKYHYIKSILLTHHALHIISQTISHQFSHRNALPLASYRCSMSTVAERVVQTGRDAAVVPREYGHRALRTA